MPLLTAACGKGDAALKAWEAWSATADLDRIAPADFALLPLAFRNLQSSGVDDLRYRKAGAIYRQTWVANQLALRRAGELGAELESRGIRYALGGGAAAALVAYPDPGARPFPVVDVLVRAEDLERAAQSAREAAVAFHTRLAPGVTRRFTASLLEAARPRQVGELTLRVLAPADIFLLACDPVCDWGVAPRAPRLADAWRLLETLRSEEDWERLLDQARAERVVPLLRATIAELQALGATQPPGRFRERLAALAPGFLERLEYYRQRHAPGPLRGRRLSLRLLRQLRAWRLESPAPR